MSDGLKFPCCVGPHLDDVYEDVDARIDGQHQVVEPTEESRPHRPVHQPAQVQDLPRLVHVGHHLGGVAEQEDEDDAGEQGGHGVVPPVLAGDGIVQYCVSRNLSVRRSIQKVWKMSEIFCSLSYAYH